MWADAGQSTLTDDGQLQGVRSSAGPSVPTDILDPRIFSLSFEGLMSQACLYVRAACPGAVSTTRHSPLRLHKVAISPQSSSAQTSIPFTSVSFYSFFYMSNQAAVLQYTLIVRCTFSLTGLAIVYGPMSFCVQYSVFHSFISKFYVGWGLCFYVRGGPLFLQCDICLNEQSISEVLTSTATLVSA